MNAVEHSIARIASRQHGLITTEQLYAVGVTPQGIARRVANGSLIRIHRGVYRVGHLAPNTQADYLAAQLACGTGSVLAGLACAHNYRIATGRPAKAEVIAPSVKRIPKIITRRATLEPRDVTTYRGIPSLTVPALMIDLAPRLSGEALSRVAHKADAFFNVTVDAVAAAARRRGPFPGIAKLRELYVGDAPILLSKLEEHFHAFLAAHSLPTPQTNRREAEGFVDCRFPLHRLTVELDSYRFHRTRKAWEAAYDRRRAARARGDRFRAYTWFDVVEDQAHMLGELREDLAHPR